MTIEAWLEASTADAKKRGLPDVVPLIEALAAAARTVRAADFKDDAARTNPTAEEPGR